MDEPLFSVVIPSYNRAHTLARTLASVRAQRAVSLEIILVDDGSTDHTGPACAELDMPSLQYIRQANAGPAAARNAGAALARGRYLAWLDADDRWHPDYLRCAAAQLATLDANCFLYGQIVVDRGVGRYWIKPPRAQRADEPIYDYLYLGGGFMQTSTLVVPRPLGERVRWAPQLTFGDNDQYAIDLIAAGGRAVMQRRALVWYDDSDSDSALSQLFINDRDSPRYRHFFDWMHARYPVMSARAVLGFEAHFVAGLHVRRRPWRCWAMLWRARRAGAISWPGLARQLLQHHAPRLYRFLTNCFVRWRGLALSQTPFG